MSKRSTPTPTSPTPTWPLLSSPTGATYSPSRTHRYLLWRTWNPDSPRVCFVLLNPSTATAQVLDPTLTRCKGFAVKWGFGGMVVANAFALRSTSPAGLKAVTDPTGPRNDDAILYAAKSADRVVLGWGNHASYQDRHATVMALIERESLLSRCGYFRLTASGMPTHPLYLPADMPLLPFAELPAGPSQASAAPSNAGVPSTSPKPRRSTVTNPA